MFLRRILTKRARLSIRHAQMRLTSKPFGVDPLLPAVVTCRGFSWSGMMPEKTSETLDSRARDFYNKALAALERGNLDYAIEMFMQTLAVEPNFTKCRQFLRAAQMKRAESLGTIKKMMTSAKVAPTVGKAKMALGKNPIEAM